MMMFEMDPMLDETRRNIFANMMTRELVDYYCHHVAESAVDMQDLGDIIKRLRIDKIYDVHNSHVLKLKNICESVILLPGIAAILEFLKVQHHDLKKKNDPKLQKLANVLAEIFENVSSDPLYTNRQRSIAEQYLKNPTQKFFCRQASLRINFGELMVDKSDLRKSDTTQHQHFTKKF